MEFRKPLAWALVLIFLAGAGAVAQAGDAGGNSPDGKDSPPAPPLYYVMLHSPGPAWVKDVPFREQPGVDAHVQYMRNLLQQGLIVMGGPFLDDSGGMMIARSPDLEEARRVASQDPAVKNGLLRVQVRPWMVPMSTVN